MRAIPAARRFRNLKPVQKSNYPNSRRKAVQKRRAKRPYHVGKIPAARRLRNTM